MGGDSAETAALGRGTQEGMRPQSNKSAHGLGAANIKLFAEIRIMIHIRCYLQVVVKASLSQFEQAAPSGLNEGVYFVFIQSPFRMDGDSFIS